MRYTTPTMLDISQNNRFLPVHVINPRANPEKSLHTGEELESLITTFGGQIIDRVIQRRDNPDNATYIGKGKVEEVLEKVREGKIDVVVLNAVAKPRQVHALTQLLAKANPAIQVWDRVDLILQIFDKHATTTQAKLQIKLARMRYMGPRIYGMGFVMSRQGGGIGTSGIGETNTELMKRHWRNEIKKVQDELDKLSTDRELQLSRRKKAGLRTISLVGYTNAGKSSLFNLLTGKKMLVANALFATLDSSVGEMYIQALQEEVLITDTIGFIRNLPMTLVNAFKSTLMESLHADILLHVIDASDPEILEKIRVVNEILESLGRNTQRDVLYVFNKMDSVAPEVKKELIAAYDPAVSFFISVKTEEEIVPLQKKIASILASLSSS